jgi:hypothetical protein
MAVGMHSLLRKCLLSERHRTTPPEQDLTCGCGRDDLIGDVTQKASEKTSEAV